MVAVRDALGSIEALKLDPEHSKCNEPNLLKPQRNTGNHFDS